jgi:hypothetical protein
MLIAVNAIVPCIFVIVPMVIAIIVTFAWANNAAQNEADQAQQEGAFRNTLGIFHRLSNAVDSTALTQTDYLHLIMAIRNSFVGAVPSLCDQ